MTYLKVLFAISVWGVAFAFTKQAVSEISPLTLITLRCALGSAVMLFTAGSFSWLKTLSAGDWAKVIFLSVLGVIIQQMLQAYALLKTTANHAGWLIALTPLIVAVLSAFFLGEKISKLRTAGFGAGFAGALLVVFSRQHGEGGSIIPTGAGDLLFIISCFTWAVYVILMSRGLKDIELGRITMLNMTLSFALLLPVFLLSGKFHELGNLSRSGWIAVAFLGILGSGICYNLWNSGVETLGPSTTASFIYFQPFATLAAASFMLNEHISPMVVTGGLLILSGVYWVNGGRRGADLGKKIYCALTGC